MACVSATHEEIQQRLGSIHFSSSGFCPNGSSQVCAFSCFARTRHRSGSRGIFFFKRRYVTIEQVCVREGQRLEISVCQAQAGLISHYRKEGDDNSGQFKAVLFMLGQAPQQRSQAYIQCRLEILMYIKKSQGNNVTSTASGSFELFYPARAGTAGEKKRVAFGCKTHTQNFHSTTRHLHHSAPHPWHVHTHSLF